MWVNKKLIENQLLLTGLQVVCSVDQKDASRVAKLRNGISQY
jgi:hypothetical protein